jgi:hypothetical protein
LLWQCARTRRIDGGRGRRGAAGQGSRRRRSSRGRRGGATSGTAGTLGIGSRRRCADYHGGDSQHGKQALADAEVRDRSRSTVSNFWVSKFFRDRTHPICLRVDVCTVAITATGNASSKNAVWRFICLTHSRHSSGPTARKRIVVPATAYRMLRDIGLSRRARFGNSTVAVDELGSLLAIFIKD